MFHSGQADMGNVGNCNLRWYWGRWLVKQVKCSCNYHDTTTAAPLMDSLVASVRCPPERTGAWEQKKLAGKILSLFGGEDHEGFAGGVAVADPPIICL